MSVRLTKKSLLSVPTRSVKTPCWLPAMVGAQYPHAANQHGHFAGRQPHQLGAIEQQFLGTDHVVLFQPVAETIGHRFQHIERFDIGHGLAWHRHDRAQTAPSHRLPAALAACSMPTLPASTITSATLAPVSPAIFSSVASTLARRAGSLPSQSFAAPDGYAHRWRHRACPSRGRCGRCPRRC
jgi:hypothetical protein